MIYKVPPNQWTKPLTINTLPSVEWTEPFNFELFRPLNGLMLYKNNKKN